MVKTFYTTLLTLRMAWLVGCNQMGSFLGVDSACCPFRVAGHEGSFLLNGFPILDTSDLSTCSSPLWCPSFVSSFSTSSFSHLSLFYLHCSLHQLSLELLEKISYLDFLPLSLPVSSYCSFPTRVIFLKIWSDLLCFSKIFVHSP